MNFRNEARSCVARARTELASGDDARLKYAALELRFAMEALTYERAATFVEDLPPSDYEVWEPRKLMKQVLEIDSTTDKDSVISFGIEENYGEPARVMQTLGGEKVLSFAMIRKHYDALGNHLHVPTLKQQAKGGVKHAEFRNRCETIVAFLQEVLASQIWNAIFGVYVEMVCECGHKVRRRMPPDTEETSARCIECGLTYTVKSTGPDTATWQLDVERIPCLGEGCSGVAGVASGHIKLGKHWICQTCGGKNEVTLGLSFKPPAINAASDLPAS
ncbi:hypothetical protein ACDA55_07705 [Rhizobium ruizarguesonis]